MNDDTHTHGWRRVTIARFGITTDAKLLEGFGVDTRE